MKAVISIKQSLFASAVAMALITTAGSVNGYDVVVSNNLTYGMKRSLRIAAEEAAEEEMADDSECGSLDMAQDDSECGSLDMAGEDSECESLDVAEEAKGATSEPTKPADDTYTNTKNTGEAQQTNNNGENTGSNTGTPPSEPPSSYWTPPSNSPSNYWTPPSNTGTPVSNSATPPGGNAPTTNSGETSDAKSGVNEKYSGSMSDIEFSSIQSEANPGTVMPQ